MLLTPPEEVIEKKAPEPTPLIRRLSVPPEILVTLVRAEAKRAGLHGCITTTRILIELMKKLGVEAEPMSVQVLVFNPYVAKQFKPGKVPSKKALERYINDRRGWSLGIGFPPVTPVENVWDGHLVAVLKDGDNGYILDCTLDQANRPEYKIALHPVSLAVNSRLWEGAQAFFKVSGCAVIYKPVLKDESFKEIEDWASLEIGHVVESCLHRIISTV